MKIIEFVLLLVLGIAALQALIWIPIIVWLRRRYRDALGRLSAETQSENVLRPPEKARYRGATAPNYPGVSNNGVIALTKRRLVFLTVTGKSIEIPGSEIRGIHQAKVFKSSVKNGLGQHAPTPCSVGVHAPLRRDILAVLNQPRYRQASQRVAADMAAAPGFTGLADIIDRLVTATARVDPPSRPVPLGTRPTSA
jgi:hypothetical protein